ncbi:MAG: DUF1778 domain-containing protein [Terracidiphilus sp.]
MATLPRQLRTRRINARISDAEEALLRRGAQRKGQTLTQFVVESACAVAEVELGEQREFTIPPDRWPELLAALDKPTTFNPRLHSLLAEPSAIEKPGAI